MTRANHETWQDAVRLREDGAHPAVFAAIDAPVLMLHGAVDPHPGVMIRASLEPLPPAIGVPGVGALWALPMAGKGRAR